MLGLNRVFFLGNLGADPEVRYTAQGTAVATMRVACNEKWHTENGSGERTTWMRVVAWGRLGENCAGCLRKGSAVFVEGRLQQNEWEDREGVKRRTVEIVANTVRFLERSEGDREGQGRTENRRNAEEEDIPF